MAQVNLLFECLACSLQISANQDQSVLNPNPRIGKIGYSFEIRSKKRIRYETAPHTWVGSEL